MQASTHHSLPSATGARAWIAISALALVWLAMLLAGGGELEQAILIAVHVNERPLVLPVLFFTRLGDWEFLVGATFLSAAWLLYRRKTRLALFLIGSTLLARAFVAVQKTTLGRLRPEHDNPFVVEESFAYPSGHSANSMIVYLLLALLLTDDPAHRRLAVIAAVLLSLLIGLSRVLLGVHWPSDVAGGWAFGLICVLLSLKLGRAWALNAIERFRPGSSRKG